MCKIFISFSYKKKKYKIKYKWRKIIANEIETLELIFDQQK